MSLEKDLTRRRAVEVHDETAAWFASEYGTADIFESPFRYGRHLIDRAWAHCVSELPTGAKCLDVGCGIGTYMARLLEQGYKVSGIEPSHEMRRLAEKQVPANLISDGSVLELPATDSSLDFVYAIEVFRYLDTQDNQRGHREIVRALRPGGIYFGTYVNRWALDGFRQLTQFRRLASRLTGGSLRYHVEFESPSSLEAKLKRAGFSKVSVHGAMLAPLRIVYKLSPNIAANVARRSMPHESRLSDQPYLRALAGHLMVIAHR